MKVFRQRARAVPAPARREATCARCGAALPLDGWAIQAESILDGAEPALFHVGCAPPADGLRWHGHREVPVRAVREDAE